MEKVKLRKLIEKPISGEWGSEGNQVSIIRSTNFTNEGRLNLKDIVKRDIDAKKVEAKKLKIGDIIIEKSGGSPTQPVGRVVYFELKGTYLCNNFTSILRPKTKIIYPKYLHYLLFSCHKFGLTNNFQNKTTGIINLKLERYVDELDIPLIDLSSQQKIANILDKADELRQYNQQLIEKYDALTQSLFLDMFGDPVRNEKKFIKSTVGVQCSVKGGKRVPKDEKLVKENTGYPYIKAGNIKKGKVTTKDLEYLLPTTREKLKRYIVNEGDVCITVVGVNIGDIGIVPKELNNANLTENANKLLIKDRNMLNSFYLASYFQMDFIQKDISKKTMAVGVPKLALFRIEQLELLLPPIELQIKFQKQVESIEAQKQQAQEALAKSEALFQGLLQQAFNGGLN